MYSLYLYKERQRQDGDRRLLVLFLLLTTLYQPANSTIYLYGNGQLDAISNADIFYPTGQGDGTIEGRMVVARFVGQEEKCIVRGWGGDATVLAVSWDDAQLGGCKHYVDVISRFVKIFQCFVFAFIPYPEFKRVFYLGITGRLITRISMRST